MDRPAFLSPQGAPWLVRYQLDASKGAKWRAGLADRPWSMWRYRELLPMLDSANVVDLGEGGTPMMALEASAPDGIQVWFKQEAGNPAGSFKARGLSVAVNRARELGASGVQVPSAGNAALSLCTFASAAGLAARVAMPEDTPETIVNRCKALGAEVWTVGADLTESADALRRAGGDYWTLSTLKEPYRVEGKKTMGLELAEQFEWNLPDWIVYPTGGGTGLIGMIKAFDELEGLGLIDSRRPRFVAVQMAGCAPIVRAFEEGATEAAPWANPQTRVWGLRVPRAVGDFLILEGLRRTEGIALQVEESGLEDVRVRLVEDEGIVVGPEGAACYLGLTQLIERGLVRQRERVVLFQTGDPSNYD